MKVKKKIVSVLKNKKFSIYLSTYKKLIGNTVKQNEKEQKKKGDRQFQREKNSGRARKKNPEDGRAAVPRGRQNTVD